MGEGHLRARIRAVKAALCFGECAQAAGLTGASRAGWDCPVCDGEKTVQERPDHQGGRCAACETGFDGIKLVGHARGLGFLQALALLERTAKDKAARKAGRRSGDLFGTMEGRNDRDKD